MEVTGSQLIAKTLKAAGVEYAFGVPGGQLVLLLDALEKHGIKFIHTRHEQAAAHMADAYHRLTGKVALAIGTVGPGAADLVPGVYEAWSESSALVAITAQNQRWRIYPDTGGAQGADHFKMFEGITKWRAVVWDIRRIPQLVSTAVRVAQSGHPRPVMLDFPSDNLFGKIDLEEITDFPDLKDADKLVPPAPDAGAVAEVAEIMKKHQKVAVHAGGGVLKASAVDHLRKLAEKYNIPVVPSLTARGVFPESHHLCFLPLSYGGMSVLGEAEVVLVLGARLTAMDLWGKPPMWKEDQILIQVDTDSESLALNRRVKMAIQSHIQKFLQALLEALEGSPPWQNPELESYREAQESWQAEFHQMAQEDSVPLHPLRAVKEICSFIRDDDLVVLDGGNTQVWANYLIRRNKPYRFLAQNNSGMLGGGLPKAITAAMLHPQDRVFFLTGDGAFMFNVQELETIARLGLKNLLIFVFNDRAYGMIAAAEEGLERVGVDFYDIKHHKLMEAIGGHGKRVQSPQELRAGIDEALERGGVHLLDVIVDRQANLRPPDLETLEAIWMEGIDVF